MRLNPINLYSGFLEIELFSDFVRGRFPGVGDLPRMPKRNGISFEWSSGSINAEIRFSKVFAQNKNWREMKPQQIHIIY